jgi:hypothetical protein
MTTYASLRDIEDHRAAIERFEAAVPAPKCKWCAVEMRDTRERAVCDHISCERLESGSWGVVTVGSLATDSRMAFAQYIAAEGQNVRWSHEMYLRAEVRFRRALDVLAGRRP